MTRLPSGSRSRVKPSPVPEQGGRGGAVDLQHESGSWGSSGRPFLRVGVAQVEGDLDGAPAAGGAGVGDRLFEALQRVGGRHQPAGAAWRPPPRWPGRRCGPASAPAAPARCRRRRRRPGGPRGARAGPGRRWTRPGMPDQHHPAPGAHHAERLADRVGRARRSRRPRRRRRSAAGPAAGADGQRTAAGAGPPGPAGRRAGRRWRRARSASRRWWA